MELSYLTLGHVLISLVGIGAGFGVLSGLMDGKVFPRWTECFLITTVATSVSGFFFPFKGITPGIVIGVVSLVLLAIAIYALYGVKLRGIWGKAFVVTAIASQYLNVLVLIVQLFQKMPALKELAPNQSEPPFVITQVLILLSFLAIGLLATKRFRSA